MLESRRSATIPLDGRVAAPILASVVAVAVAAALGAPAWVLGVVGLAPWAPLSASYALATWRSAGGWLALFLILAATQTGHVVEHIVQVVQLRVLALPGDHAHGIFGALDIEWVHFTWNAWVMAAVVALLIVRRDNGWLWVVAPLAAWHLMEHAVLIATYLATGREGNPGLLAMGGLLANGLPLARPELHLAYNLLETAPLLIGFLVAWRRLRPPLVRLAQSA